MDIAIRDDVDVTRRDNTHTRLHIFYHLYKTHDLIEFYLTIKNLNKLL